MKTIPKKTIWYPILFILLIGLIAFLSFYKLDVKYVDPWDEARHGVNAYEMANGGSLIQSTYMRQADYYNLKPPLSMYDIMLGMAIFGNTVFALRFYAALSYVLLALCVGLFTKRYGKLESLLAVAFLAVNTTAFQAHMIRSGDADSLYVLLFTLAMICMMKIRENGRYSYACAFLFALAFLTKSYHAGLIAVIGGLFLLLTGELKKWKAKNWLLFLAAALLPIMLWAAARYRIDGMTFFQKMWEVDVLGRTDGTLQNNIAPFSYYLSYYFGAASGKITPYLCALVICLIAVFVFAQGIRQMEKEKKRELLGWALWILVPLLAFSAVSNKLLWYVYPSLVPLLALAGICLGRLLKEKKLGRWLRILTAAAGAFILLIYGNSVLQTIGKQNTNEFQELIKTVAKSDAAQELVGCTAFVDYGSGEETEENWSQQDVFVAEAYGDYTCVNGGITYLLTRDTLEEKTGILFLDRETYREMASIVTADAPLGQSEHYVAVSVGY